MTAQVMTAAPIDLRYIITPKGVFKCSDYRKLVKPSLPPESIFRRKPHVSSFDDHQTAKKQKIENKVPNTKTIGLKKAPTRVKLDTCRTMSSTSDDQALKRRLRCELTSLVNKSYGKLKPTTVQKDSCSRSACAPVKKARSVESTTKKAQSSSRDIKASRAAMLKRRFAHTTLRTTHNKVDESERRLRMQQETERLEREKQERLERLERAKRHDHGSIEAKIEAAKAALQRRDQQNLKMNYERERADARMALEQMEKSVEIYEDMDVIREIEMLFHCCQFDNPLEGLGLRLKDDYLEDEDVDAILDAEEGEILP